LPVRAALKAEWNNGIEVLASEGLHGAARFSKGAGRHGDFSS
jgi:hypothetical protein